MAIDACPHCGHTLTQEEAREMAGLPPFSGPLPKPVPEQGAFNLSKIGTRVRIARDVMLAGGPWGLLNRSITEHVVTSDAPALLGVIERLRKPRSTVAGR